MISIVLPVYNEEKNIAPVLGGILNFFKTRGDLFEIITVNDGSADNTLEILLSYEKKGEIKIISHPENRGYGAALISGFKAAKGDLIFFMDSDRQFDIADISVFLEKITNYDFIAGFRKKRQDSTLRILNAKIFNLASRIFFGVKAKDIDCAFKLFKKEILREFNLTSDGALINLEIFAKARKKRYKFLELPVRHFKRIAGKPTGGSLQVVFKAIVGFLRLKNQI